MGWEWLWCDVGGDGDSGGDDGVNSSDGDDDPADDGGCRRDVGGGHRRGHSSDGVDGSCADAPTCTSAGIPIRILSFSWDNSDCILPCDISYKMLLKICVSISLMLSVQIKNVSIVKVKLVTVVKGDQKAPFSIATTPRCKGGRYSFSWIAPLYPWYVPYIAEC